MSSDTAMFTQCPKCQTVFRVTIEQLQIRNGLVRCGNCNTAFQADQHLYADLQVRAPKKSKAAAALKKTAKTKAKSPSAAAPSKSAPTSKPAETETEMIEVTAAPAPWSAPTSEETPPKAEPAKKDKSSETKTKETKPKKEKRPQKPSEPASDVSLAPLLERRAMRTPESPWWIVGSVFLFFALVGQATYFYRDTLADYPLLRPAILGACETIGCVVHPHSDVNAIELIDPTGISPHPRAANALRLRATLVNRSSRPQPYPLMQVTLTDSTGRVLSRRTFAPKEYLEQPSIADSDMPPHLAISALLDLTNPEGKAVGYQIDFVAAPVR